MDIKTLQDLRNINDMRLKLKYLTRRFGISISFLAKGVRVHRTTLSNYREGYYNISQGLYDRLEQFLLNTYGI